MSASKNYRIKYTQHPTRPNCLVSAVEFVSEINGARYKVVLDIENRTYAIRNERTKEFVKTGQNGNMNVLKRNARSALASLGVRVGRESRDRTFGVCPKEYSQELHEKLQKEKE